MADIKCTTAEEVYEAIEYGNTPEVYGDFTIDLESNCDLIVREGSPTIRAFVLFSTSCIYARGTSSPLIQVFESSYPDIRALDFSTPTIEIYDSGDPDIRSGDWSEATVISCGKNEPHVLTFNSSKITVRREEEKNLLKAKAPSLSSLDVLLGDI